MMRRFVLAACLIAITTTLPAADVPKGDLIEFNFDKSKIFPGTTRVVKVYVPKQYDGKTPACVWVNQDGVQYKAPDVFDKLIAEKSIPVMVGVFVMHGRVPAPDAKNALDRFNRSFEYDGLGDGYVRFILDEIFPEVEKLKTPDSRAIKLSRKGNDCGIGGSSSGAICAFNAAWERPDAFSRVFSAVGTYVGLRGGNIFPTMVRKTEPKPIRVFLEDGSNDLNIYAGDWWMVNQEMERAFIFAGYEVNHSWGDGKHNSIHATEVFPDAMKWLWKDYPKPIGVGLGSPQMQDILIPGEGWKLVGEGYVFTEGPAVNAKGEVYFNDTRGNTTYKLGPDGKPVVFIPKNNRHNGQAFGPDGKLYSVAAGTEQVVRIDDTGKVTKVADGFRGNDLTIRHDGGMYVTNPPADGTTPSKVWFITPHGEKKVVDEGLKFANGVALSPDQTLLYVADSRTHWVYCYQVKPDGSLAFKQKFFHLHVPDTAEDSGADGMRTDRDGRLWVATKMGLQVCDQAGRVNCIIPTPNGKCSNLTFGGPNFDTLYVTCGDKVYSRKVKVKGANSFEAPFTPAKPKL